MCSWLMWICSCLHSIQPLTSRCILLPSSSELRFCHISSRSLLVEVRIRVTLAYYRNGSLCCIHELCSSWMAYRTMPDNDSAAEICGILSPESVFNWKSTNQGTATAPGAHPHGVRLQMLMLEKDKLFEKTHFIYIYCIYIATRTFLKARWRPIVLLGSNYSV